MDPDEKALQDLLELRARRDDLPIATSDAPEAIKADPEQGIFTGYLSRFWVVDAYAEATAPGCFARTILERGPKANRPRIHLRYEHEWTVGKWLDLHEDAIGLFTEGQIADDGLYGSALRSHLALGVPYGESIGFRRVRDRSAEETDPLIFDFAPEWIKRLPIEEIRILTEVRLSEGSIVTFPAVDNALVDGYRSERAFALLTETLTDLKAGRLDDRRRALVADLVAAWPAARGPEPGETPAPPPPSPDIRRQLLTIRFAELERLIA